MKFELDYVHNGKMYYGYTTPVQIGEPVQEVTEVIFSTLYEGMTLDKGAKLNPSENFYDPSYSKSAVQVEKWYNDYMDEVCLWGLCV